MSCYAQIVEFHDFKLHAAMAYRIVKTVKGRRYIYEPRTWREGKRVRSESRYIGPADGGPKRKRLARRIGDFIRANMMPRHMVVDQEKMLKNYNERVAREQQEREAWLGELHDKYGLRVADTPRPAVVTPQSHAIEPSAAQPDAKESPSVEEGQDDAQNS